MKKVIASKFVNKVCLVDKYGDIICELKRDGGYYVLPDNFAPSWLLDIGDEYHVEEIESEID